ncbi:hypothetical protein CHS0354_001215 [Potamilus streckersoni]|uniref:Uncharacterized protein n=1 Tax=Potamilus streckersoni TaxID=2493646 RepID=A0AAE0VKD7_9BIVA|nr:hypothetical protein CHS0354_001215 [Potamilus streckersoni]
MTMINCYVSGILLAVAWYPTTSMVAVAVCEKRTLDGCLKTISSLIEDDDNLIYRISAMCSESGQQATRCAIRELVNCPNYLSKPTGHDMQLHFLEEITVQDQTDACVVWSGIPDKIKDTLRSVYNSKMTEICVMMASSQITQEPDGSFNACGYINLRDKCALQTIHEQYPQYERDTTAVINASLVFSSCVEHRHDNNGSSRTARLILRHYYLSSVLVFILLK